MKLHIPRKNKKVAPNFPGLLEVKTYGFRVAYF